MTILPTVIGVLGSGCYLGSYWMAATGRWSASSRRYVVANACASAFTLVSLTTAFNLGVMINNTAWFAISAWSLFRVWRRGRAHPVV